MPPPSHLHCVCTHALPTCYACCTNGQRANLPRSPSGRPRRLEGWGGHQPRCGPFGAVPYVGHEPELGPRDPWWFAPVERSRWSNMEGDSSSSCCYMSGGSKQQQQHQQQTGPSLNPSPSPASSEKASTNGRAQQRAKGGRRGERRSRRRPTRGQDPPIHEKGSFGRGHPPHSCTDEKPPKAGLQTPFSQGFKPDSLPLTFREVPSPPLAKSRGSARRSPGWGGETVTK